MQTEKNSGLNFLAVNNNANTAMVFLHGYGASMHDLYDLHQMIHPSQKVDWYFPDGHIAVALGFMMEGRAWFSIDMAELERAMQSGTHRVFADKCPDEFLQALEKLEHFIDSIADRYEHIILGGFSQGAMLATHLGVRIKKVKALILFSSTLLAKDLLEETLHSSVNSKPFFQSHGIHDPLLGLDQSEQLFELLNQKGLVGKFVSFAGGHEIPMPVLEQLNSWLKQLDWV